MSDEEFDYGGYSDDDNKSEGPNEDEIELENMFYEADGIPSHSLSGV